MRIGLLGCGNVGAALVELIAARRATRSQARTGLRLEVARVAVACPVARSVPSPCRPTCSPPTPPSSWTTPTSTWSSRSSAASSRPGSSSSTRLKAGKPVVTANKELLANVGAELFAAAETRRGRPAVRGGGRRRHPDHPPAARVAGGRARQPGHGHRQRHDQLHPHPMTEEGATYADALAEAQALGYAERDPTADVEGYDAGAKAAIIATIAFGAKVVAGDVYHEGISGITATDIDFAGRLGLRHQAAGHRRAVRRRRRSPCGCTRRWCRSPTRWPRCATASTPCSSRATPSAT